MVEHKILISRLDPRIQEVDAIRASERMAESGMKVVLVVAKGSELFGVDPRHQQSIKARAFANNRPGHGRELGRSGFRFIGPGGVNLCESLECQNTKCQ